MRRILLTGDSHLGALRRAVERLSDERQKDRFVFWPLGTASATSAPLHVREAGDDAIRITAPAWQDRRFSRDSIAEVGADALLVVSLPLHTTPFLRDHAWHTHAPWQVAVQEVALSSGFLDTLAEAGSRHALALVLDLARIWPAMAVLEPPRLFPDSPFLAKARPEVCRAVEAAYRGSVRRRLAQAGIAVIDQPPVTITDQGMTDPTYDNENPQDRHHANARYGSLVLAGILAHSDATA